MKEEPKPVAPKVIKPSVFEQKWFKIAVIASSVMMVMTVVGSFYLKAYFHERDREKAKALTLKKEREYEDKFRSAMTRIYQNLKLDHFLAAYKNLETLPEPPKRDPIKIQEYLEVLQRVGNGLIQNQLLKEAESVFLTIREHGDQLAQANEALSKIESKRYLESAKIFLRQADMLLAAKRYREAFQEYQKTELALRSIEVLKIDDVKEYWVRLKASVNIARFYTLVDDADREIRDVARALKANDFEDTQRQMTKASNTVSRAAFYQPQAPEIADLRRRLADLDAELGYRLPNSFPVWNLYSKEDVGKTPGFFNLVAYDLQEAEDKPGYVRLGIKFLADSTSRFYVVRYRIYFFNGGSVFNGHFLELDPNIPMDAPQEILYLQEIPERLRGASIQRLEVKVFNADDKILARVLRAFRKTS